MSECITQTFWRACGLMFLGFVGLYMPACAVESAKPMLCSADEHRASSSRDDQHDVVIYGGTSGAVVAAIRCAMLGANVVLVSPDKHFGGLSSGGLGYTDSGNTRAIGGLAREFYCRVWKHYQSPNAWKWQPREAFGSLGQEVSKSDADDHSMWLFEPHVAEQIFDQWLEEHGVAIIREALLDREKGVELGKPRREETDRHGILHAGFSQCPPLRHPRGDGTERRRYRRTPKAALPDRLRFARAEASGVYESTRPDLPLGKPHCVRVGTDGACLYAARRCGRERCCVGGSVSLQRAGDRLRFASHPARITVAGAVTAVTQ